MYLKNLLFVLIAIFSFCESAFALTIINQTNSVKNIEIEEAYRPEAKIPGNLAGPISLVNKPKKIIVEAYSIHMIQLSVPCPVLLIGVVTIKEKSKLYTETTEVSCYEPYDYDGENETLLTDDWGIVIHEPMMQENLGSPFDSNYVFRVYMNQKSKEDGYGIKCVHPKLLEKMTSLEDITEEFLNEGASPVVTRSY